jgi:Dockerin type I domain
MFNSFLLYAKLSFLQLIYFSHSYKSCVVALPKNPIITCKDIIISANPNPMNPLGGCVGQVNLKASAVKGNDCNIGEVLYWDVLIDKDGDGLMDIEYSSNLPRTDNDLSNDTNGNGLPDAFIPPTTDGKEQIMPSFFSSVSEENHKVIWTVIDGCGNTSSCATTYKIMDKKAPTPYCISLGSALLEDGKTELFAIDFNKGSFDNCTTQNELLYTFNNERPVLSKIKDVHFFKGISIDATEEEYNTGQAQKWLPQSRSSSKIFIPIGDLEIHMSVWDKEYNTDVCKVTLWYEGSYGSISGKITNKSLIPIEDVKVLVEANALEFPQNRIFDGTYYFSSTGPADYTIKPSKSDDYTKGINTMDLVLLQEHLSGKKKLTTPEQLIAADINGDGKIGNSDYFELKKMVLGMIDKFSQNKSWTFIPKSYIYPDPSNPFSAPRSITVTVTGNVKNLDFIGIKIGDLDGSIFITP